MIETSPPGNDAGSAVCNNKHDTDWIIILKIVWGKSITSGTSDMFISCTEVCVFVLFYTATWSAKFLVYFINLLQKEQLSLLSPR